MIDYERLLLIVKGDVHEDCHQDFDIESIVANATEKNGKIIVITEGFQFVYDSETYEQLPGCMGC